MTIKEQFAFDNIDGVKKALLENGLNLAHDVLHQAESVLKKSIEERRWIPVTKRLPEESYDSVIGWDAQRKRCVFVQFYNGQFQISGSNETFDITHWMPMITSPYEESETK